MTENEALKLMESLQISKDCELIKTLDFKATVIKALERQVPKKPNEVNEKQDGLFYVLSFVCPTCNEPVIGQPYKPNHCKHCGQRLDWEGGE